MSFKSSSIKFKLCTKSCKKSLSTNETLQNWKQVKATRKHSCQTRGFHQQTTVNIDVCKSVSSLLSLQVKALHLCSKKYFLDAIAHHASKKQAATRPLNLTEDGRYHKYPNQRSQPDSQGLSQAALFLHAHWLLNQYTKQHMTFHK